MKRTSITLRGMNEEFFDTVQGACNFSNIVNRALIEALKNPAFVHTIMIEEISNSEVRELMPETLSKIMGAIPQQVNGAPNVKKSHRSLGEEKK